MDDNTGGCLMHSPAKWSIQLRCSETLLQQQ
jgi:hypothetical protein